MESTTHDLMLKAIYAGHSYLTCLEHAVDSFEAQEIDTAANQELLNRHYANWKKFTKMAVEAIETGA